VDGIFSILFVTKEIQFQIPITLQTTQEQTQANEKAASHLKKKKRTKVSENQTFLTVKILR